MHLHTHKTTAVNGTCAAMYVMVPPPHTDTGIVHNSDLYDTHTHTHKACPHMVLLLKCNAGKPRRHLPHL